MSKKAVFIWVIGTILVGIGFFVAWTYQKKEAEHLPEGMPANYPKLWLKGDSCSLPCWQGITPGITTAEEAVVILNSSPAIKTGSALTIEHGADGQVTWDWLGSEDGGYARYDARDPNHTIYAIRPLFGFISGINPVFTLDEVIKTYGEPSHIAAFGRYGVEGQGPFYRVIFYWDDLGISIEQRKLTRTKPRISPSMEFTIVNFHSLPFDPKKSFDEGRYSIVWQGYKTFNEYCTGKPKGFWKDRCIIFP
jgi:hypothetical protein